MKKITTLLILGLISLSVVAQSNYLGYPTYNNVVGKFFEKYSVKDRPSSGKITDVIKFEKRPTGWYIIIVNLDLDEQIIEGELFWSRKKGKFIKVNFKKIEGSSSNEEYLIDYQKSWSKRFYAINPFFGYKGWEEDVIKELENKENLPDTALYSLGRAYSTYASNLLNDNSGFAKTETQFVLPLGKNCLTDKQLEIYRHFRHLAIEKFNILYSRNPEFEVLVGSIGVKASNEYLTSFLDLRIYQSEEEAKKELTHDLYDNFTIATAKNYLNSCAKNAILFVNGDNDTYPLLYVQAEFGVRTDVVVANLSLLSTERYINHLRYKILDAPPVPISLSQSQIKGKRMEYLTIEMGSEEEMELMKMTEFIKNELNINQFSQDNIQLPTNHFLFKHKDGFIEWEWDKPYMLRNQYIVYDILSTNNWKRPIYFALTVGKESFYGLSDYFQIEGLAYRFILKKTSSIDGQTGIVNTSIMFENLMNKFVWVGGRKGDPFMDRMLMNYRNNYSRLATALMEENKNDSAILVLDKCIEVMSNELSPYNYFILSIAENYHKLEEFKKGNQIINQLIYNIKNNINTKLDGDDPAILKQRNEYVLTHIELMVEQFNQKKNINLK